MTQKGPMRFEFIFGRDGQLHVAGRPSGPEAAEVFELTGAYRVEGSQLISEALNQGQPVELRFEEPGLSLRFDEELEFRLRRRETSLLGEP